MPEDALIERELRLHGNDDSLDSVEEAPVSGQKGHQNGHQANDIETGSPRAVGHIRIFTYTHLHIQSEPAYANRLWNAIRHLWDSLCMTSQFRGNPSTTLVDKVVLLCIVEFTLSIS